MKCHVDTWMLFERDTKREVRDHRSINQSDANNDKIKNVIHEMWTNSDVNYNSRNNNNNNLNDINKTIAIISMDIRMLIIKI